MYVANVIKKNKDLRVWDRQESRALSPEEEVPACVGSQEEGKLQEVGKARRKGQCSFARELGSAREPTLARSAL